MFYPAGADGSFLAATAETNKRGTKNGWSLGVHGMGTKKTKANMCQLCPKHASVHSHKLWWMGINNPCVDVASFMVIYLPKTTSYWLKNKAAERSDKLRTMTAWSNTTRSYKRFERSPTIKTSVHYKHKTSILYMRTSS
jgi:hypothetical protein